ncbi:MAG: aminoacyl-tRNA hydrolase [Patescibacteria group bacterium]
MLIIGLGNKERKYEKTRHNAGHLFADFLNCFSGDTPKPSLAFRGVTRKSIKTNCFMNQSGGEVLRILGRHSHSGRTLRFTSGSSRQGLDDLRGRTPMKNAFDPPPASLREALRAGVLGFDPNDAFVIVHDDMDIPLGKFKISFGVSASGHKGVLSIIEELGTRDFWRIRIGVAPHHYNHHEQKAEDFVLNDFNPEELEELQRVFERIVKNPIFKGT